MKFLVAFIIFCISSNVTFAKSQRTIQKLYGNYLKGLFSAESGDKEDALVSLKKAKSLDPQSLHIRLKIASIYLRLGKIGQAEKELKSAKSVDPKRFDASLALIFLYSYSQQEEKLEAEYEDFLRHASISKPKDVKISEHLAQFYFHKKELKKALEVYEKILKNNPEYIQGAFWLGYLYEEIGQRQEAISMWKKALEIDPEHAPSLNSLGYVYAEEGVHLDEAEDMIKKALVKDENNGAYLDSLGWVYFKKKDYKLAEEYLKKAVDYEKDPVIYAHIGDLYVALGNLEEAINYYEKGIAYFPENKELKEKMEKYGKENKNN